jgi:lipoate synthase
MLRLEVRNSQVPIEKKPSWIKTRASMGPEYTELKALVKRQGLATGVRGGRLPQHLRVLGGPRGDLPHRR